VQMHTGYGDRDLDLVLANPALLRPLLEQTRFEALRLVLLHASYPYTREASYLAAVYPQVYVDFSEVNPMLPHRQLTRVLEELLALSPYTKLLYGSDAWGIPDWIWLGARTGRRALAAALVGVPGVDAIARRILRDNARELYGL
jgi:predicted TIM-barrel fold metal-dependent hydrolase